MTKSKLRKQFKPSIPIKIIKEDKQIKMPTAQPYSDPNSELLADISVKLRDMEEKQNLIKDRVLLIGENLVSEKEDTEKTILDLKLSINKINDEIKRIKMAIERVIEDNNNFARKNELQILERQFEMFQPLELARISDVEEMINRALQKHKSE